MNIIHYSAFRAIMLTGTVKGAAEMLNKSQPTISRLLDRLEYDLGLSLFVRRKGLITPTPEAYLLLEQVEKAHSSLESLRSFALNLASGEYGSVTIASMPALGIKFIPSVLRAIKEKESTTKYILNVAMSPQIEEWAAFQKIDFGFAEYPFTRTGFKSEIFSDTPYLAAVPCNHSLAGKKYLEPKDLAKGPLISWSEFLSGKSLMEQVLYASNVKVEPEYETTLSAAAYEMVKAGLGVALIDPFTASQQQDDKLVKIMPFYPGIPFKVALLVPDARPQSTASRYALEIIKQQKNMLLKKSPA